MKTEAIALQRADSVESFIALVSSSVKDLVESANMLVRLRANDEDVMSKITEAAPAIPLSLLANLIRVGEGSLHPNIVLNGCPAYRRLAALPFSSQEAAMKSGRVLLVIDGQTGEALNTPLVELTPSQAAQVFSPTGPRSKDEQQGFIRRKQIATAQSAQIAGITGAPYSIRGKAVFCNAGCVLTQQDLIRLLGEMAK
jgi:hypothetical protein